MKNKIATIFELQAIPYKENGEPLVNLENSGIRCEYRRTNSGVKSILVRESVFHKLQNVQRQLAPNMQLIVVEGYRRFAFQEEYFLREFCSQFEANPCVKLSLLLEQTHQLVALPSVAGHPTGGAIDLTIAYNGQEVDMGGEIADFRLPHLLPTYSQYVTNEQSRWRIFLHNLMIAEDFAPFYGEWWHFSHGDREWAAFYNKTEAIYSPIL